jgi:ADP-heptose:LPS heptosyltransferase
VGSAGISKCNKLVFSPLRRASRQTPNATLIFFVKKTVRKILIVRFSSIGDIVLTTPVVRCLKKQLGAEIHYLTKRAYLPLLEANPYLDKIFTIEKKIGEVLPALKQEGYDALVDLHKNLRSLQVRWRLGAKVFSFQKLNFEKWLLVNFKIDRLPDAHVVDRYLAAVAPLGIHDDRQGLDYFLPEQQPEADLPPPYVAFAIGAAHQTKRLPAQKIVELCKGIRLPVVLLGGKAEQAEGERIARDAGAHVRNFCGKLSLHGSAAVIRQADLVVTHDTGMMHIAAAFQKEILTVWGSTVPAFGMYPYFGVAGNKNTTFEVKNLTCRPCSKIGFDACPKGHFRCMNDIETEKIIALANGSTAP